MKVLLADRGNGSESTSYKKEETETRKETELIGYSSPYSSVIVKDRDGNSYTVSILSNDIEYQVDKEYPNMWWNEKYSGTFRLGVQSSDGKWHAQDVQIFTNGNKGSFYDNNIFNQDFMFYPAVRESGKADLLVVVQTLSFSVSVMTMFYMKDGKLREVIFEKPFDGSDKTALHSSKVKVNEDGTVVCKNAIRGEANCILYSNWKLDEETGIMSLVNERREDL